jgi:hypothetical protein
LPLTIKNYGVVVVSVGEFGDVVVVSTGVVVVVSVPVPDWFVDVAVSEDIGGLEVSEPVEFSGVSQPIAAIAKKATKRMLFMRITLMLRID